MASTGAEAEHRISPPSTSPRRSRKQKHDAFLELPITPSRSPSPNIHKDPFEENKDDDGPVQEEPRSTLSQVPITATTNELFELTETDCSNALRVRLLPHIAHHRRPAEPRIQSARTRSRFVIRMEPAVAMELD